MNASIRTYSAPDDFTRIRDFLKESLYAFGAKPVNQWDISRWNWCRYHPNMFRPDRDAHIRFWEGAIRILETDDGRILAVVCVDAPEPWGEAFINYAPGAEAWLGDLVDIAEATLAHPETGDFKINVADHDLALQALLRERSYRLSNWTNHVTAKALEGEKPVILPPGYRIRSMAEAESRLDMMCQAIGRGFDHVDPAEWCRPEEYRLVQSAPDYRPENDIVIEAPNGDYVSHCIVWHDDYNRIGVFEPVSTHAEYRMLGLGRALMQAGMNRLFRQGARRALVGSGMGFYLKCGFAITDTSRDWIKENKHE